MIDLLAKKTATGDLYIDMAVRHLAAHEWGQAKLAIERAIAKGQLSDPHKAQNLLRNVCTKLGVCSENKRETIW